MEDLIRDLRDRVCLHAPDLQDAFEMYADEACFARSLIDTNLSQLRAGARILEIGAGMLLLSSQLRREGFTVTALEPVGEGFAHFQPLHKIVLDYATEQGFAPVHLTYSAEQLDLAGIFDFAFSVNVMEHVRNFPLVLERVYAALRPGAAYRFVCPNYTFPYEPHYNIPTLFSKALTEKLMLRWIMKRAKGLDPAGTWNSLNWISVAKVRRTCRRLLAVEPSFDPAIFNTYLERTLTNAFFLSRRGPMMVAVLNRLRDLGLLKLTRFIPVACLPAMDCTLHRHSSIASGNASPSTPGGAARERCEHGNSENCPAKTPGDRSGRRADGEALQAAFSVSANLIGTSTPSAKRAASTNSPFIASMNFLSVPI